MRKKREHGKEIDEQALAICYSECGEAKGNIDQESLENITKIDLLKKKKNIAQDDSDVTSKNKKKITMPKKASIFVKSKKTKEQHLKELEDYELQMQSFSRKKG